MLRKSRELWLALLAILFITVIYLFMLILDDGLPAAGSFFGHLIGILGFMLMLMTEVLYTLRKRSRLARWGRVTSWLQFHIFTGLVGPYLVLLHTSWKFNGVAGVLMLLTIFVVASGFAGRYIYTAVPRTAEGIEVEAHELQEQIARIDAEVQAWLSAHPAMPASLVRRTSLPERPPAQGAVIILGRAIEEGRTRLDWWRSDLHFDRLQRAQVKELEHLLERRAALRRQMASLVAVRGVLSIWHAIHVPIGLSLFTLAFVHIAAAVYYATMLR
ncbi:MAG: hypothetical protein M1281_10230 [Chloroflexi bacterium]|nr:hypothetical protein [Chloroflexota bacterium]